MRLKRAGRPQCVLGKAGQVARQVGDRRLHARFHSVLIQAQIHVTQGQRVRLRGQCRQEQGSNQAKRPQSFEQYMPSAS